MVCVSLLCNDFYYLFLFSIKVMKCGMHCSLFDVIAKSKQGNCLSGLLHKMEKEKMVSDIFFLICMYLLLYLITTKNILK